MYTMVDLGEVYKVDFPKRDFNFNKDSMKNQLDFANQNRFHKNIIINGKEYSNAWIFPKTPRNNWYYNLNDESYSLWEKELLPITDILLYAKDFFDPTILKSYQLRMLSHMLTHERCINAAKMRSGKTLPTLLLISYLMKNNNNNLDIVFLTTKNSKYGIHNEIKKWKIPRLKNIVIETYDWFTEHFDPKTPPHIFVFDEAQKLKNDSQRTRHALFSTEQQRKSIMNPYILMLSGTPAPNHQNDWWYLTEIIQPGFLSEGSKIKLMYTLANMSEPEEGRYGGEYSKPLSWKKDEIINLAENRLKGLVEVYNPESYSDFILPVETIVYTIPVKETDKIVLKNLPNLYTGSQLRMIYRRLSDGITPELKFFETNKDKKLMELLDEYEDDGRFVLNGYFRPTLDKLEKLLIYKGWDILRIDGSSMRGVNTEYDSDYLMSQMDASNERGKPDKLCTLIQCDIAEGMEFSASRVIVYYSNSENPSSKMQSKARIQSQNQKFSGVQIIELPYFEIDYKIITSLENKESLSTSVLDTIELIQSEDNPEKIRKRLEEIKDATIYDFIPDEMDCGIFHSNNDDNDDDDNDCDDIPF